MTNQEIWREERGREFPEVHASVLANRRRFALAMARVLLAGHQGVECWDPPYLEVHRFYHRIITGVGSCALGFADPDVDNAVKAH